MQGGWWPSRVVRSELVGLPMLAGWSLLKTAPSHFIACTRPGVSSCPTRGTRRRTGVRTARVQGAGDDQRWIRMDIGACRQSGHAQRGAGASPRHRVRGDRARERRFRRRLRRRAGARRRQRDTRRWDRYRRTLHRGLHWQRPPPALRLRSRRRAHAGRTPGNRRERHGHCPDRPLRGVRVRPSRHRRDDQTPARARMPEPTASTLRGSTPSSTLPPSSPQCRPSR